MDMLTKTDSKLAQLAPPCEELKAAYDAVMRVETSSVVSNAVELDSIAQMAARESEINPLQADERGLTQGLRGVLRSSAAGALAPWLSVRSRFEVALQPFIEKINAVRDFDIRKSEIERKTAQKEAKVLEQAETDKTYVAKRTAKEEADRHYAVLIEGVGGRPVNSFSRTWLYLVILGGITSIEWLINYDSFFAWTGVPAIAAGFTIGMALAVALAAHVHGEYLKQRNSRFGPDAETIGRDVAFLILATVALAVAVVVAGWARYSLVIHNLAPQGPTIDIPGGLAQPDPMTDVYFSLGINLIVWLIGLVIAFMSHDENEQLLSAWAERRFSTARFDRAHKPWAKRAATIRAQGAKQLDQLSAATNLARGASKEQKDMLDQVAAREQAIYGALAARLQNVVDQYRIALGAGLRDKGHRLICTGREYSGSEYQNIEVTLNDDLLRSIASPEVRP